MGMPLRELFDQASALPVAERGAWLEAHCPDAALRAEVLKLLAADAASTITPQRDPLALAEAIGTTAPSFAPGARLGPFVLEAALGEGGSSTVYRAHRELDGVRQTVALKVLRRGLNAPDARRQFDRERQALAQLQHPHIAQFIDGGVDADGTGWLALEFVDGSPITHYARDRGLGFRERIALMTSVARAVAAAHRSLIVHRDLKPGNIFVTRDGHAKLLDFGIAKLLAENTTEEATQTQFRAFTPAYAAPEQRQGGAITTATDVYALGIVLGELVTGQRLTEGGTGTPSSRIRDDTAPGVLPAEPRITRRLVRGDLDNILMKAMEEEPERRYATAAAFADDLERLLAGQPVSAHPPSGWYRAKKFAQRHRGGVAITLLLSLAVLVSLGVAIHQGREAQRQAEVARQQTAVAQEQARIAAENADLAKRSADFMTDLFATAESRVVRDQRATIDDIIAAARDRLANDTSVAAGVRARVYLMLAGIAGTRRDHAGELEDIRSAIAALDAAGDRDSTWRLIAEHTYAETLWQTDPPAGLAALEVFRERTKGLDVPQEANGLVSYITAMAAQAPMPQVLALIDEWRALETRLDRFEGDDPDRVERRAVILILLMNLRQFDAAEPLAREIEALYADGTRPSDELLAAALGARSFLLQSAGKRDEARALMQRVLEISRAIHGDPSWKVAGDLRSLATVTRDRDEAVALLHASLEMYRTLGFGADTREYLRAAITLAEIHLDHDEAEEALAANAEPIRICATPLRAEERNCAIARWVQAVALAGLGRAAQARDAARAASEGRHSGTLSAAQRSQLETIRDGKRTKD